MKFGSKILSTWGSGPFGKNSQDYSPGVVELGSWLLLRVLVRDNTSNKWCSSLRSSKRFPKNIQKQITQR